MPSREIQHWWQATVPVTSPIKEAVSNYLFEIGATGVIEKDGAIEAFFPSTIPSENLFADIKGYLGQLEELGFSLRPEAFSIVELADRDWNSEWKKNYHAIRISAGILIKPSWEATPSDAPPCVIEIDPEMAFGTGTHATTKLTLRLMEKNIRPGTSVLDIGTGTGILAIAAAKLGAGQITAIDVDPLAATTAQKNAAINGVVDRLQIFAGSVASLRPFKYDLVMANLNREQILKSLPFIKEMLDYRSVCLFSGILAEEEKVIREQLLQCGFSPLEMTSEEEWLAFKVRIKN